MTDSALDDDELVARALRMNWEHARHIEAQRLQLLAVHVAITLGLGYAAIYTGAPAVRVLAAELGFCLTLFCWGITHKLNSAFVFQIWQADRCARRLAVRDASRHDGFDGLHSLLGFPRKAPGPRFLNVRTMFHFIYFAFALNWVLLLAYAVFRLIVVEEGL